MPSSSRIYAHTQNNITNETTIMIRKQKRFAKLVRLDTQNVDFHDVRLSVSGELLLSLLLVLPNSRALQKSPLLLYTQEEREDRKWVAVWWPWSRRRETSFSPNPNPRVRIAFVWNALFLLFNVEDRALGKGVKLLGMTIEELLATNNSYNKQQRQTST